MYNPVATNKWRLANKEKYMLNNVRNGARKRGIEFNITEADIIIPTHCPLLGIALEWNVGKQQGCGRGCQPRDNSPSIDRIDNNKGYIRGNVRVVSYRANSLKKDATLEELQLLVDNMTLLQK